MNETNNQRIQLYESINRSDSTNLHIGLSIQSLIKIWINATFDLIETLLSKLHWIYNYNNYN